MEDKQSTAASSSYVSEGSGSSVLKSPDVASPATVSSTHMRKSGPIRRAKGGWTPEEDETLREAVGTFKAKSWKKIVHRSVFTLMGCSWLSCHKSGGEPSEVDGGIAAIKNVRIYKYKEMERLKVVLLIII